MCLERGVMPLLGITVGMDPNRLLWVAKPSQREFAPGTLGPKEEKSGGDYSTVKSAQRLSATLSIRPRGRVQIIDM